jgi:nucleoside-diphosphate-sugar epimerase
MKRLLIVGCGDVGLRLAGELAGRRRIFALTHSAGRHGLLRAHGVTPLPGDLDSPASLGRIGGLAHEVVHLAPPPSRGDRDTRTAHLIRALARGASLPQRLVYISTSGVYGDCGGARVAETRPVRPANARAVRRVDAERQLRAWGRANGVAVSILRVPGIYSSERLPLERLRAGTPVLEPSADPYTNHVHAEDLARIIVAALSRGRAGRLYNASDDTVLRMGEWFDMVAARFGLPRPPRVDREQAGRLIPETLMSFMRESRRLVNDRIRIELRVRLRHPTVAHALDAMRPAA